MEHRNGARKASNMLATLSQNGNKLGIFLVKNISEGGLAISGCASKISTNSLITVQIKYLNTNKIHIFERKAIAVHQNTAVTGLMWAEYKHLNIMDLIVRAADARLVSDLSV